MDFGRTLVARESIASRSKVRHLPLPSSDGVAAATTNAATLDEDAILDRMVLETANQVAVEVILGPGPYKARESVAGDSKNSGKNDEVHDGDHDAVTGKKRIATDVSPLPVASQYIDASHYKELCTPPTHSTIQAGDLVVIMEAFDKLDFVYATPGDVFHNRNGHFHHDDFINKYPFGSMIRSSNNKGYGFVYLLKPTPELWARSLNHRTQIVQELDQVQVVYKLQLRPNMRVIESGTGSGAMSHAILRTIAPKGHLYTFEFNQHRAETARQEFKQHGVEHLVTVTHQDVCTDGFCLPAQSVDACFLDLPEPWLAVPHAVYCLKPGAHIASYSPCVEQTQKACAALKQSGCHSLQTMEYRLMEHYVDDLEFELLPTESRPIHKPVVDSNDGTNKRIDTDDETRTAKTTLSVTDDDATATAVAAAPSSKRQRLVARPFNMMKGHTAFLTFATVGNRLQPNPLIKQT
ncbi:hypothetical protein MPSEU_001028200 [Mayamaea pseudoterrestris]|nr:hypothetical protein MPSEU_001028200 [Mayamaea pseudoterrestris]